MTIVAARSRLSDLFALQRRSTVEQPNTAARPPNLRSDRLFVALCFGAIAIGTIALAGYVVGNPSIAALGTSGRPMAAVIALALIVLGAGLLAFRSPAPAGLLTARCAALGVVGIAAADLLSAAFSTDIEEWQDWAARGGVHFHAFPIAGFLILALGAALFFVTTRMDLAGHVIASAGLLINVVFLFAYVLKIPMFIDPSERVAPVFVTAFGLALISVAELLARPRGWVIPLLSRTPAGMMSRLLLPAAFVVPFLALGLRDLTARWFPPRRLSRSLSPYTPSSAPRLFSARERSCTNAKAIVSGWRSRPSSMLPPTRSSGHRAPVSSRVGTPAPNKCTGTRGPRPSAVP